MSRLCIIGCGLTGAITASLLKQCLPHVQVVILEKSKGKEKITHFVEKIEKKSSPSECKISFLRKRGLYFQPIFYPENVDISVVDSEDGNSNYLSSNKQEWTVIGLVRLCSSGRFCTSRNTFGGAVDLGAQFITKSTPLSEFQKKCYSQLLENGLIQPLHEEVEGLEKRDTAENFICSQGSGSIVKHFLQTADCEVIFNHRVAKILPSQNKWKLCCENNSEFEFDTVVFTIPVPQILQLEGIFSLVQGYEIENLKSIKYSSRFALGLFYEKSENYFDKIPWVAKYIPNEDVLRFCSLDHRKRNSSSLPSVAVHTTKEFGKKHIDDNDTLKIQKTILSSLEKILPGYPEPSFIKFHKWRYSQVENSYMAKPGCIVLSNSPPLIVGGDGFSYSTFEGCIYSSENIVKNVLKLS